MIDRAEIEKLRGFIDAAKQPGNLPWALVECEVGDWLMQHGDELLALLGATVQDNVLVPREPTEAMIEDMRDTFMDDGDSVHRETVRRAYAAMIAAAPRAGEG